MTDLNSSTPPEKSQSPTYEWNNQRWVAEYDLSRPYHFVLRNPDTEQRLPFATEAKRQAFVDTWLAVQAAVDALAFAVRDSIAVKSRIIADGFRDENGMVNSRLEVK